MTEKVQQVIRILPGNHQITLTRWPSGKWPVVPPCDSTRRNGSRTLMLTRLSCGGSPVEKQRHLVPWLSTMSSLSRAPRPFWSVHSPEPVWESDLNLGLEPNGLRRRDATPSRRRSSGKQSCDVIKGFWDRLHQRHPQPFDLWPLTFQVQVVDGEAQWFAVGRRFNGVQVKVQPRFIIVLRWGGEEGRREVVWNHRLAATWRTSTGDLYWNSTNPKPSGPKHILT